MSLENTGAEPALSTPAPIETSTPASTPTVTPSATPSPSNAPTNLSNLLSTATATPGPDLTELQSKITDYESKLSTYQPDYEFLQKYGGREGIEPFFPIVDTLSAAQFNPQAFAKQLHSIDASRYNDFVWDSVERHKADIAEYVLSDDQLLNQVLGRNPKFQLFQQWESAGGGMSDQDKEDLAALEGLDPSDPLYTLAQRLKGRDGELSKLKQQIDSQRQAAEKFQREQQQIQRQEKITNYITQQENWLTQQAKNLNWGDEYKQDTENVIALVQQRFMADPEAKTALDTAAHYASIDSPVMAKRFTQVVQAKLSQIFKSVVEHENRKIQEVRLYRESVRKTQESRKDIPSGGGRENASLGSTEITGSTLEERVIQRALKGVQAGRIPNIFGPQ